MKQFGEIEGISPKKMSFQSEVVASGFLGDDASELGRMEALRFRRCFTGTNLSGSSGVWPFTNRMKSHVPPRCMEGKRRIVDVRLPSSTEAPNGQPVHVTK